MVFASDRQFTLWDFNVSHTHLLLRSAISISFKTNIDIMFIGVEYLELPARINGVSIVSASSDDIIKAERGLGRPCDGLNVYCIVSNEHRYLVVAFGFQVMENELEWFDSSLGADTESIEKRQRGKILARSW